MEFTEERYTTDLGYNQAINPNGVIMYLVERSPIKPNHKVSVIIPVYRNVEITRRCVTSAIPGVLSVSGARIVVINDNSPETDMQAMLEEFVSNWPDLFVLIKNDKNLGFVGSVNHGFECFQDHDVVLLNSDTVVPYNWLERLIEEAYSHPRVGTVTPFSNNATICSFPQFLQENVPLLGKDVDSIDTVFRHDKLPCIQTPTGVGFCMYIRRTCLDAVGYFDQVNFGKGYGEENDFCQRAAESGWINIITPNLYVHHEGSVSFSIEKQKLVERAMQVIDKLHPNYHAEVQSFIKHDPLRLSRCLRYIQLCAISDVPKILHISHGIGGGVDQHIEELAKFFYEKAVNLLLTPYGPEGKIRVSLGVGDFFDKPIFDLHEEYDTVLKLFKLIGVGFVHFHHTLGLDNKILDLPHDLGVPYTLTVHDFYWMNGNPTLTDENGIFPGFYSDEIRNPLYPLPGEESLESWQARYQNLINNAYKVIFPSISTMKIFRCKYQLKNWVIAPHIEFLREMSQKPLPFTKKDKYIVGALGALSREKGADLLEELQKISVKQKLNIEFVLIGYAYRPLEGIKTSGPYKTGELKDLIKEYGIDIIFFPARWPETYSYTLSYALESGLPIMAPNLGAFPERLSGRRNVILFDHLMSAHDVINVINKFIIELESGATVKAPTLNCEETEDNFYTESYLKIAYSNSTFNVVGVNDLMPILSPSCRFSGFGGQGSLKLRHVLTAMLWRLYMNPSMRWISYLIPYSARRFVKRLLVREPIHDVVHRHK